MRKREETNNEAPIADEPICQAPDEKIKEGI